MTDALDRNRAARELTERLLDAVKDAPFEAAMPALTHAIAFTLHPLIKGTGELAPQALESALDIVRRQITEVFVVIAAKH